MKYLSVVAVFGLIAIVATNDAVVPNTLHRLRRQSTGFSSSSSSSSSSAAGGAPGTFHQTSSSIQSFGPVNTGTAGINLEDRFGGSDTGGNGQVVTGHFQSVGGYVDPNGQPHIQHNIFQQYPNTNYQQQN